MNKNVQPKEKRAVKGKTRQVAERKQRPVIKRDIVKDNDIVRIKGDMDRTFLILVIIMICFGSVMVFSASYAYALASKGNSYFFIERQHVRSVFNFIDSIFVL